MNKNCLILSILFFFYSVANLLIQLKVNSPVIHHDSTAVRRPTRRRICQPVDPPHNGTVPEVKIGCKIKRGVNAIET